MATMDQIRDREQRLREALRLGVCTGADPVRTCLARLREHDRLAAQVPELLAMLKRTLPFVDNSGPLMPWRERQALAGPPRQLVARAEGKTEAR